MSAGSAGSGEGRPGRCQSGEASLQFAQLKGNPEQNLAGGSGLAGQCRRGIRRDGCDLGGRWRGSGDRLKAFGLLDARCGELGRRACDQAEGFEGVGGQRGLVQGWRGYDRGLEEGAKPGLDPLPVTAAGLEARAGGRDGELTLGRVGFREAELEGDHVERAASRLGDRLGGRLRVERGGVEVQQEAEGEIAHNAGEGGKGSIQVRGAHIGGQESVRIHAGLTAGTGQSMQGPRPCRIRKCPRPGVCPEPGGGGWRAQRVEKLICSENRPTAATLPPFMLRAATRQRNRPLAGRLSLTVVEAVSVRLTRAPFTAFQTSKR